ncbi:hypothetical protein [Candidatus Solincola tengchongensis]|uniref:hypothetical protein n=1 Tax=Candidatus Solincola tengchongensis TaxID=2900693 RepID=UPI00257CF620|nr:hypothetical protein [Candidatus Solincola tengchongensis]
MHRRESPFRGNGSEAANSSLKVRISKGFIDAAFGEGFLVEVWDFRRQKLIYGERYKELEKARRRLNEIKNDLDSMSLERFRQAYLSRHAR